MKTSETYTIKEVNVFNDCCYAQASHKGFKLFSMDFLERQGIKVQVGSVFEVEVEHVERYKQIS